MLAMKKDLESPFRRNQRFEVGDRVVTSNSRLGTVIRVERDEWGEYYVLTLDVLAGEFAYDCSDLEKA